MHLRQILAWVLCLQVILYLLNIEPYFALPMTTFWLLPYSDHGDMLRFEIVGNLGSFLPLSPFLYYYLLWNFFLRLTSNCALISYKKGCLKNFENIDIANLVPLFEKMTKFGNFFTFFVARYRTNLLQGCVCGRGEGLLIFLP